MQKRRRDISSLFMPQFEQLRPGFLGSFQVLSECFVVDYVSSTHDSPRYFMGGVVFDVVDTFQRLDDVVGSIDVGDVCIAFGCEGYANVTLDL